MKSLTSRTVRTGLIVGAALLGLGAASAAEPGSSATSPQLLSELIAEVRQLRIEVAVLRLAWREQHVQALEEQIRAAEGERRSAELEDAAGRDEIVSAEALLAGSELDPDERAELTALKNRLLIEDRQQVDTSRSESAARESALRAEWERACTTAEASRHELAALRDGAAAAALKSDPAR